MCMKVICPLSVDLFSLAAQRPLPVNKGYFLLPEPTVDALCAEANLPCPAGAACLCRPCQKLTSEPYAIAVRHSACSKMSICASPEQREAVAVTVRDNWSAGRAKMGLSPPGAVRVDVQTGTAKRCYAPPGREVACGQEAAALDGLNGTVDAWDVGFAVNERGTTLVQVLGAVGRDASEGRGPQRWPERR